jgi:membrane-bound serine protease (ClpP class)
MMRWAHPLLAAILWSAVTAAAFAQPAAPPTIVRVAIDGAIEPVLAEYVQNGIARAAEAHATLVLIRMNTPGGLDASMRAIISAILASPVPVCVYVAPDAARAASAGFFVLQSADIAAMSPGTETGAASPLLEIGGYPVQVDPTLRKKIVQDTLAFLRSYVGQRGRNVALAETAVTDARSFTAKEALDGHLIDLVAGSERELLAQLNGRTIKRFNGASATLHLERPAMVDFTMSARERFLSRIVQPDALLILLLLAGFGLYVEFTHPGLVAPAVVGLISLVLALFAMQMLPVNMTGILLIVLAIGLFVLEATVAGHGIFGIGGAVALLLGALLLVRSPMTTGGVAPAVALGAAVPFALAFFLLARLVRQSRRWKPATGSERFIGLVGTITAPLEPDGGMIFVLGEWWRAVRAGDGGRHGPLPKGLRVRIVGVEGLRLIVEPADEPANPAGQ